MEFTCRKRSEKSSGGTKLVEKRRKRLNKERQVDGVVGSLDHEKHDDGDLKITFFLQKVEVEMFQHLELLNFE